MSISNFLEYRWHHEDLSAKELFLNLSRESKYFTAEVKKKVQYFDFERYNNSNYFFVNYEKKRREKTNNSLNNVILNHEDIIASNNIAKRKIIVVEGEGTMLEDYRVAYSFAKAINRNVNIEFLCGPAIIANEKINKTFRVLIENFLENYMQNRTNVGKYTFFFSAIHQPIHFRLVDDKYMHYEVPHEILKGSDASAYSIRKLKGNLRNDRIFKFLKKYYVDILHEKFVTKDNNLEKFLMVNRDKLEKYVSYAKRKRKTGKGEYNFGYNFLVRK